MDLKDKQKIVSIVGGAQKTVEALEKAVYEDGSPSKANRQLLRSISHSLDLLKSNPFVGQSVKHLAKAVPQLPCS